MSERLIMYWRIAAILLGVFLSGMIITRKVYFFFLWRKGIISGRAFLSLVLGAASWLTLTAVALAGIIGRMFSYDPFSWHLPALTFAFVTGVLSRINLIKSELVPRKPDGSVR